MVSDHGSCATHQAARAKQKGGADMDLVIIEGYDGPQPG